MSIQAGFRITEDLQMKFAAGKVTGEGSDEDGEFSMAGTYTTGDEVTMTRVYTYCTHGEDGVGVPYTYHGKWDGALIYGNWTQDDEPENGGPFEMWPEREEDIAERRIELEEVSRPLVRPLA